MLKGNPNLRRADEKIVYTQHMQKEFAKCYSDILYFGEKYCHIITLDRGRELIKFWDFQKKVLKAMTDPPEYIDEHGNSEKKRFIIINSSRQISKTTLSAIYILHYAIFNEHKTIAVLGNKEKTAIEIMNKITQIYEGLPFWLQPGIMDGGWSKSKVEFGNGSRIISASTSSAAIRGYAINCLTENNVVTIRDKITNEIKTVTIGEFKNSIQISDCDTSLILNDRYEILTPSGFKDFAGLLEKKDTIILKIETEDGNFLELTPDHKIYTSLKKNKKADKLKIGDKIQNISGKKSKITNISYLKEKKSVYDFLNVKDEHKFFANNLLVSNCLFLDEFAFIPTNIAEEFMTAVYPTISSGKTSKIIIVSTPNGMNHFYNLWNDAVKGRNQFYPIKIHWYDRPDRDENFKKRIIKDIGITKWNQEFSCSVFSSLITLKNKKTGEIKKIKIGDLYEFGENVFL